MLRFQALLKQVNPDGTRLSPAQRRAVAARLEPSDVADIVRWMEHLAVEKADLPDWDGESSDDIAKAQAELAGLLVALRGRFGHTIAPALALGGAETQNWLRLAQDRAEAELPEWRKWLRRLIGRRRSD